ncbi:DUF1552 domain-containing protein [Verrucomicrobium spinosum]|uniref:DUF1552 domain-containing protein n=1 Tax=Verrucomicrobium spinosum TaxID=2736 RepID=UPI000A48F2EA|nr:DUF1552 domain-containing protein [Verrucomicrobium spinosum]
MDQFWPASPESFLTAPPPALESLRPVLDQCLLMKGISGVPIAPFNGAPHALELSTWLTATLPDANRRNQINIAISADQIAANYVGGLTSLPSLELATMPQTHKENQEGLNEGYYSHCSFRSPTQAVPAEINPRNVLNRLFKSNDFSGQGRGGRGAGQSDALDRSMLDLVIGGAKDLRRTLPQNDQHKLDEYLDSVRSLERRIASIEFRQKEAALEKAGVSTRRRNDADSPPIEIRIPEGDRRSEYMQVMCDLNVLAFQTDTTRVSTYIGSTPNGVSYPELVQGRTPLPDPSQQPGRQGGQGGRHHRVQHLPVRPHGEEDGQPEGGRRHPAGQLHHDVGFRPGGWQQTLPREPAFIIAGKGGGSINTGRFLADTKGNQGDLLTTLLACAGVPLDRPIGIATKQITEMMVKV